MNRRFTLHTRSGDVPLRPALVVAGACGFTVIAMLIVVVLLGLLTAMAYPRMSGVRNSAGLRVVRESWPPRAARLSVQRDAERHGGLRRVRTARAGDESLVERRPVRAGARQPAGLGLPHPAGRSRARGVPMNTRGFTLVEAMVAIVVMAVGVLGLAGSAAVMTRQMSSGSRMAKATVVARSRVEQLSAQDCTKLASGSASSSGVNEQWLVIPVTRAVRVKEKVTVAGQRTSWTRTYVTLLP